MVPREGGVSGAVSLILGLLQDMDGKSRSKADLGERGGDTKGRCSGKGRGGDGKGRGDDGKGRGDDKPEW
jgi:hypothetical protein